MFKNLFKKAVDPEQIVELQPIGSMKWDEDGECWRASYQNYMVSVAYEGLAKPESELSAFVERTLGDSGFIDTAMGKIRATAKTKYPNEFHQKIDDLKPCDVIFQSSNFILIQFFGPKDHEPFWFAEIHGTEIQVGFDT